jgi:hypothetical protein
VLKSSVYFFFFFFIGIVQQAKVCRFGFSFLTFFAFGHLDQKEKKKKKIEKKIGREVSPEKKKKKIATSKRKNLTTT